MPILCSSGCGKKAILKRPKTGDALCKECFFWAFEEEVHHTITAAKLFSEGEYVAIAASGGKDSTVLAHLMTLLNERYQYGLRLVLLSIDEGITGYRDDSLETVKRNEKQYKIPLKILSYEELYGWTMDKIVQQVGRKNNCTFCGVFRRQALDRGAVLLGVNKLVTGHNADDIAETIVMNILRGDVARLQRCCAVETGSEGSLPRSKPFKYTYEKEIVMYAYFKKLDYFSTECIYSPNAYRGHARAYIKDLEKIRPSAIIDIIHSGECLSVKEGVKLPTQSLCSRCGHVSSQAVCKACVLLEGLNKGRPKLGVGKSSKVTARMKTNPLDLVGEGADNLLNNSTIDLVDEKDGDIAINDTSLVMRKPIEKEEQRSSGTIGGLESNGLESSVYNNASHVSEGSSSTPETDDRPTNDSEDVTSSVGSTMTMKHSGDICDRKENDNVESTDIEVQERLASKNAEVSNSVVTTEDVAPISTDSASSTSATGSSGKVFSKRVFSPRVLPLVGRHVNGSAHSSDQEKDAPGSPAHVKGKCSSTLTSIEDIGNDPIGKVCANGGKCSSDCKNKGKVRKIVSLKQNPDAALKTAGISKKDLDF